MTVTDRRALSFVRALLAGGQGTVSANGLVTVRKGQRTFSLAEAKVLELASAGIVVLGKDNIKYTDEARSWLKRQLATTGETFAAQHRTTITDPKGVSYNLDESPLKRLSSTIGQTKQPYLFPHQIEAGERLSRLVERAQLRQRVTMSYAASNRGRGRDAVNNANDISDQSLDACRQLRRIQEVLPEECVGVVMDICGFEKGLQLVEQERGWPRRSAKLVLRIGLEQLAAYFGLTPVATGGDRRRHEVWMGPDSRPKSFGGGSIG